MWDEEEKDKNVTWLYYCNKCGNQRDGLLNTPWASWHCPECGSADINTKKFDARTIKPKS